MIPVVELRRRPDHRPTVHLRHGVGVDGRSHMLGIHGIGRDKADYYLSDLARELPVARAGPLGRARRRRARAGGPGRPRRLPAPPRGPAPRHRAAARVGPDLGGGVRPDLQRAQVGQRAVRPGRCRRGARRRRRARRGGRRRAGVPRTARHHRRRGARARPRAVLPTSREWSPAVFTHGVNRNRDPHLHSHVVDGQPRARRRRALGRL